MASPNATFTEMVTTTARHTRKEVVDNVTDHNAVLRWMKEHGNVKTYAKGGYEIQVPISYAENATYQRYSGYDVLNTAGSDVLTSAKFDWMQAAIHVTASGRELKMNNSEEAMLDLVKERKKVAVATAANNMSIDIYSDGSLSNQVGGLAHLITSDGTGTVGGIVAGTYTFWKNKFQEISGTGATFSTMKTAMNTLWLALQRGADKPDLIVMTHDFFAIYEGGLQDLQRYGDSKAAALGFSDALKYKSASVIFDDNTNFGTTSEIAYFLNTKYLYLMEHPEAQWTTDDEKVPTQQDAVVVPMYWMGNMCVSNRSLQGKMIDAA